MSTPEYNGVPVDNPRIIEAIKQLVKQGYSTERIVEVVGMPWEVVTKYEREYRRHNK